MGERERYRGEEAIDTTIKKNPSLALNLVVPDK
jgi:hypothetical protein